MYIEHIFGFNHEDYNYKMPNKLLGKDLKGFIKILACYP